MKLNIPDEIFNCFVAGAKFGMIIAVATLFIKKVLT